MVFYDSLKPDCYGLIYFIKRNWVNSDLPRTASTNPSLIVWVAKPSQIWLHGHPSTKSDRVQAALARATFQPDLVRAWSGSYWTAQP